MNDNKILFLFLAIIFLLLCFAVIFIILSPDNIFYNDDFNIPQYISSVDKDSDGIDDQTDILLSVREYLETEPYYKSKYYSSGYPDDNYGVCTDVVAFGLLGAGYDLMELVNIHITDNRELYDIETVDKAIDFRRVRNLKVFFPENFKTLTTDVKEIGEWQGGDIVLFEGHVGIISDKRNSNGIPYVLHNGSPLQSSYEQDILDSSLKVIGHYRVS